MKIRTILATLLTVFAVTFATTASAAVISVNFVGGRNGNGGGAGSDTVTGVAGVVPVANWNNAVPANGSIVSPIKDTGGAGAASIAWTSSNTWSATGASPGGGGNAALMSGYLDNFGGDTITVTGLSSEFTGPGYNIFVYFHEDSAGSHGASALDNLGNTDTAYAFQSGGGGSGYPLGGTDGFIVSTSTNSATTSVANVILLEGYKGANFTISGLDGTTGDGRTRPNGIQIVALPSIPEPASLSLLAMGGLALLRRRRNA